MDTEQPIATEEIRAQIERIVGSSELAGSVRLCDFLRYVVEETLCGRGTRIKGLTIAQAVFGADASFDPDSNSIVRVEAGRLRRRLKEYYAGDGQRDPILVEIPKGSYAPEFKRIPGHVGRVTEVHPPADSSSNRRLALVLAALAIVAAVAWTMTGEEADRRVTPIATSQSPAGSRESEILFQQAFEVLMPPEDGARLNAAIGLFERVVEIDPTFAGGYAGKSLAHSFRVLFIKSGDPTGELAQAIDLGRQAATLDPGYSLAYSALALAYSLGSETDRALENVRRSLTVQPRHAIANAMASLVLLNSGKPNEAIDMLSDALALEPDEPRTPYLNILGIAQFVLGDYEEAAKSFESNLARGGPTGPHMDVFVAATYAELGKEFEAQAVIENLQRTHPSYPVEAWLRHYIKSEDDLRETLTQLRRLGLLLS